MVHNTKLLVLVTFLIFVSGLGFLFFGLPENLDPSPVKPNPSVGITTLPNEASSPAVLSIEGEKVMVTKVIDGDTIEIEGGARVRYIGIDTPETRDPRRPVGCFGKQASLKNKELVEGKVVILQKDISETDKYNRLLRYVFLPLQSNEALFVNDYLIREGYATVLSYPPDVKYIDQFLKAQQQAKEQNKGLWSEC